jgi:uncharacterized membrane-anchored protein
MKAPPTWIWWVVLGAVQLAVPLSLIVQKEFVQAQGSELRLRLQPVDPADPFRGRYLALRFLVEDGRYVLPPGNDGPLCARFRRDAQGFDQIDGFTRDPHEPGVLKVERVRGAADRVRVPWNRYYVNEQRAPAIEDEVRRATLPRADSPPVYATLRVAGGDAVITGLWIGGRELK